ERSAAAAAHRAGRELAHLGHVHVPVAVRGDGHVLLVADVEDHAHVLHRGHGAARGEAELLAPDPGHVAAELGHEVGLVAAAPRELAAGVVLALLEVEAADDRDHQDAAGGLAHLFIERRVIGVGRLEPGRAVDVSLPAYSPGCVHNQRHGTPTLQ